ncbi:Enoate reductase 1, partial [Candida parapsilosis]
MTKAAIQSSNLFKPIKVGNTVIEHRIAHLPTSRNRAHPGDHNPTDLEKKYYTDRAKSGALLVTGATVATPKLGWYPNVPGIWNEKQALGWKEIVDSVHAAGGKIAVQIWGMGRVASGALLKSKGYDFVGVSDVYDNEESAKEAVEAGNPLRPLTVEEIEELVQKDYP